MGIFSGNSEKCFAEKSCLQKFVINGALIAALVFLTVEIPSSAYSVGRGVGTESDEDEGHTREVVMLKVEDASSVGSFEFSL